MEYESQEFTVRKNMPPEVFWAIRIHSTFPDPYFGYLRYVRTLDRSYDYRNGDELDAALLRSVRTYFGKAEVAINQWMLIEEQVQRWLAQTAGRVAQTVRFRVHPHLDYAAYERYADEGSIKTYSVPLGMTFEFDPGDSRFATLPIDLLVDVPQDILPRVLSTIRPVP